MDSDIVRLQAALRKVQRQAVSLAEAQVIALGALTSLRQPPPRPPQQLAASPTAGPALGEPNATRPVGVVFHAADGGDDETGAGMHMRACVRWLGPEPAPGAQLFSCESAAADATQRLLRRCALALEVAGSEWRSTDPSLRIDLAAALAPRSSA